MRRLFLLSSSGLCFTYGGGSIETISITSPIYVITRGAPSEKVQAVIDFYKSEYSFMQE